MILFSREGENLRRHMYKYQNILYFCDIIQIEKIEGIEDNDNFHWVR